MGIAAINVTTLPRQATGFYCNGAIGNCSTNYPSVDRFDETELIQINVNFTSDIARFSTNATGCVVKAENNNTVTAIGTVSLTAVGTGPAAAATAICSGTVNVSGLSDGFYYITVEAAGNNGSIAVSGENMTRAGFSKQGLWKCLHITLPNGNRTCAFASESDITAPVINYYNVTPIEMAIGDSVLLNMSASDNIALSGKFVNITYPNGTTLTFNLSTALTIITAALGRHNVTFFANDTAGNIAFNTTYFEVKAEFNSEVISYDLEHVKVRISFTDPDTGKVVEELANTSNFTELLPGFVFDVEFSGFNDSLVISFTQFNVTENTGKILGLDKIGASAGFVVVYSINSSFSFANATVTISYNNTGVVDDKKLEGYICHDFDFVARQCNTKFNRVNVSIDNNTKTASFNVTNFSGFALREPSVPVLGAGGARAGRGVSQCSNKIDDDGDGLIDYDGAGNPLLADPNCEGPWDKSEEGPCIEKWVCTEWAGCDFGRMRRTCTDLRSCGTTKNRPALSTRCIEKITKPPTCNDKIKNQGEEGVDCGGPCLPCALCSSDDDCSNGKVCIAGRCMGYVTETCSDGIKNNGETGIDCGGPCKPCKPRLEAPRAISYIIYRGIALMLVTLLFGWLIIYFISRKSKKTAEKTSEKAKEK